MVVSTSLKGVPGGIEDTLMGSIMLSYTDIVGKKYGTCSEHINEFYITNFMLPLGVKNMEGDVKEQDQC